MIGPLGSYQDIYVALCGQQFTTQKAGRNHERTCNECKEELYSSEDAPDPYDGNDIETDY